MAMDQTEKLFKQALIVINAASGSFTDANKQAALNDALANFAEVCERTETFHLRQKSDWKDLAKRLRDFSGDVVLAAGGDGTLRSVVAGLDPQRSVALGFLPMGTMNVYARRKDLALNPQLAVEQMIARARSGDSERLPVGYLGDELFLLQALTGPMATLQRKRENLRSQGAFQTLARASFWRVIAKIFGEKRWFVLNSDGALPETFETRLLVVLTPVEPDDQAMTVSLFEQSFAITGARLESFRDGQRIDLALENVVRDAAIHRGKRFSIRRRSRRSMIWLLDGERSLVGGEAKLCLQTTAIRMLV